MSLANIASFPTTEINDFFIKHVEWIEQSVATDPGRYLEKKPLYDRITGKFIKSALIIDIDAEAEFHEFAKTLSIPLGVWGEESQEQHNDLDLTDTDSICALVDMVDGTDLLERGLHNWCSSAVFFHPKLPAGRQIIGAFIGIPSPQVYFAMHGSDPKIAFSPMIRKEPRLMNGPDKTVELAGASICFYGQKLDRLAAVTQRALFEEELPDMRLYTLAGMPMIVKICDPVKGASCINVVFETEGQKPHDAVPGLYIAMRSGCAVINLEKDRPMTMPDLELALMRPFDPASKLRYIIASNDSLASEIRFLLRRRTP